MSGLLFDVRFGGRSESRGLHSFSPSCSSGIDHHPSRSATRIRRRQGMEMMLEGPECTPEHDQMGLVNRLVAR